MTVNAEPAPEVEIQAAPATTNRLLELSSRLLGKLPQTQGAFWVLVAIAVPKLAGAVFTIGLRRFLGPGVAGTFDLAYTPYNFLNNFRNFGPGPALVYEKTVSRATANTAWTLNMIFGAAVTVIAEALAHSIARYYGHPEIEGVLRILAIAYIFASLGSVHFYLLLRDMDYRARAAPPIGQIVIAGDLAVVGAIWGFGVGALITRELASVISGAILLWAVYPFRPQIQLVPSLAKKLFSYGVCVGLGLTILYMSQNVDVFIGGHIIHNKSDIGFYTTSWKLAFIAAGIFTTMASSMVFPSLSRLQDDMSKLQDKLMKSVRQISLFMLPASWLVAVVAPVLIVPILGSKFAMYRDQFIVLSLLAVYAGNRTLLSIFFEGYKSIGKPWIVWAYNMVKLGVMVPAMIYGAQHGIVGLALTYIPIQIIEYPIGLYLAHRVLDVSMARLWRAARVPIISTAAMAIAVVAIEEALKRGVGAGDLPTLAACLVVGSLVYLGALFVLDRKIITEARGVLVRGL